MVVLWAMDGAWVRALTGPPGTLWFPCCVAVVPSTGEVFVSDVGLHQVVRFRSIDDDTVVGTLGTGQGDGPTHFSHPNGMVVLEGQVFPSVCWNIRIHVTVFADYVVVDTSTLFYLFYVLPGGSGGCGG